MEDIKRIINRLKMGAEVCACGGYIAQSDSLHNAQSYTSLGYERLDRKNKDIRKIYESSLENWNQTFYSMLLRFLGAPSNKTPFGELASRVDYSIILRYKSSLMRLEALLIGGSGLLELFPDDDYIFSLKREFEYLAHKHNIRKMSPSEWVTTRIYPHNHPVLQMAQAAAFLSQQDFVMDTVLKCKHPRDVATLFGVGASDYWTYHFLPAVRHR